MAVGIASCGSATPTRSTDILDRLSPYDKELLRKTEEKYRAELRTSMVGWLRCIDRYTTADPRADARADLSKGERRLYAVMSQGETVSTYIPGPKSCSGLAGWSGLRLIDNASLGDGQHYESADRCDALAIGYAEKYNMAMLAADPSTSAQCAPADK